MCDCDDDDSGCVGVYEVVGGPGGGGVGGDYATD